MSKCATFAVSRAARAPIRIGRHVLQSHVFLAPMSGVTDLPFRRIAHALGAGLVTTEMVASEHLVCQRHGARERAVGRNLAPFIVQLAGCQARWVTGKQAGSALMRDLEHASALIAAVVGAVGVPVTLKMRIGWDATNRNAPELARRAEAAGVALISVHARTRCQFFKGAPDWAFVARVKHAVQVPVIINGDIIDPASARAALEASGADAVMVGRGAYGAPWMPARIDAALATGCDPGPPPLWTQAAIARRHVQDMLTQYGARHGLNIARKHIGWYLASSGRPADIVRAWRKRLCTVDDSGEALSGLASFYQEAAEMAA